MHLSRTCSSSSISLQALYNHCSCGIFRYLSFSIIRMSALNHSLHMAFLPPGADEIRHGCKIYVDVVSQKKHLRIFLCFLCISTKTEGLCSRGPLPVFSAGSPGQHFWHGQRCPLFDVVHLAFPLPTTASPAL